MQIAITAALGFDSYLVMRHGAGPDVFQGSGVKDTAEGTLVAAMEKLSTAEGGERRRLGCYFCNDVVAPIDVIFFRTIHLIVLSNRGCTFQISRASSKCTLDMVIKLSSFFSLHAVNFQSHIGPAMHSYTSRACSHCFCSCSGTAGGDSASSGWVMSDNYDDHEKSSVDKLTLLYATFVVLPSV